MKGFWEYFFSQHLDDAAGGLCSALLYRIIQKDSKLPSPVWKSETGKAKIQDWDNKIQRENISQGL